MSLIRQNDIIAKTLKELQGIMQLRALAYAYAEGSSNKREEIALAYAKTDVINLTQKTDIYSVIPDSIYVANGISSETFMNVSKNTPYKADNFWKKASKVKVEVVNLQSLFHQYLKTNNINLSSLPSGMNFSQILNNFKQDYESNHKTSPCYWLALTLLASPCRQLYGYTPLSFFEIDHQSPNKKRKSQEILEKEIISVDDDDDDDVHHEVCEIALQQSRGHMLSGLTLMKECPELRNDFMVHLKEFVANVANDAIHLEKKVRANRSSTTSTTSTFNQLRVPDSPTSFISDLSTSTSTYSIPSNIISPTIASNPNSLVDPTISTSDSSSIASTQEISETNKISGTRINLIENSFRLSSRRISKSTQNSAFEYENR